MIIKNSNITIISIPRPPLITPIFMFDSYSLQMHKTLNAKLNYNAITIVYYLSTT